MMRFLTFSFLVGLLSMGCSLSPTKLKEGEHVPAHRVNWAEAFQQEFNRQENFLLLDARPTFEVTTSRLQRSQSIRLEDFALPNPHSPEFERELGTLARRLALRGIEPERKTWVVGTGLQGDAEEFYFVWLLKMMGVQRVGAVSFERLRWPVTTLQESTVQNALPWEPRWNAGALEMQTGRSAPYRGRAARGQFIWAMNTEKDALKSNQLRSFPGGKQLLWNSLYDVDLKVLPEHVRSELGENLGETIWVTGNRMPEIAAVFLALSSQGYSVKIVLPDDIRRWL